MQRNIIVGMAERGEEREFSEEDEVVARRILESASLYEVLQVERGAQGKEIQRAYRRLAVRVHPDKNRCPRASDAFKSCVGRGVACIDDVRGREREAQRRGKRGARERERGQGREEER